MPKMEKHTANCTPSFIIKLDNQFKRLLKNPISQRLMTPRQGSVQVGVL